MSLHTRRPSGEAGWPNLLVEGKEGTGKTYNTLRLSADPRVGTCFVIEVQERRADEYAALGEFVIVEHDGTIRGVVDAIHDVLAEPPEGGRPNVLVIDSFTGMWDLVKREAERIARSSKSAKERLEKDPDAEIEIGHQAWNKAKDRYWWGWLNDLRSWPGMFFGTARSDEVAKFNDGRPVANQSEYRVDLEKGTPFMLDATVRMRGATVPPLVTTAKSLRFTVPQNGLVLDGDDPLAALVFDLFGAGTEVKLSVHQAKAALLARARASGLGDDEAKAAAKAAWDAAAGLQTSFDATAMKGLLDALGAPEPSTDGCAGCRKDPCVCAACAYCNEDPCICEPEPAA